MSPELLAHQSVYCDLLVGGETRRYGVNVGTTHQSREDAMEWMVRVVRELDLTAEHILKARVGTRDATKELRTRVGGGDGSELVPVVVSSSQEGGKWV